MIYLFFPVSTQNYLLRVLYPNSNSFAINYILCNGANQYYGQNVQYGLNVNDPVTGFNPTTIRSYWQSPYNCPPQALLIEIDNFSFPSLYVQTIIQQINPLTLSPQPIIIITASNSSIPASNQLTVTSPLMENQWFINEALDAAIAQVGYSNVVIMAEKTDWENRYGNLNMWKGMKCLYCSAYNPASAYLEFSDFLPYGNCIQSSIWGKALTNRASGMPTTVWNSGNYQYGAAYNTNYYYYVWMDLIVQQ